MRLNNKRGSARTQIAIKEVKDGILVLPGNRYRTILSTSSLNFELKSDEEQDVLIENFQDFLNSLATPVQILVRVREIDIDSYLEGFSAESGRGMVNKKRILEYCDFIKKLVSGNKILSRKFYVVIACNATHDQDFSSVKEQMKLNIGIVVKGLEKLGIKTRQLGNIEILEMFYNYYNPSLAKTQPLDEHFFQALFTAKHAY